MAKGRQIVLQACACLSEGDPQAAKRLTFATRGIPHVQLSMCCAANWCARVAGVQVLLYASVARYCDRLFSFAEPEAPRGDADLVSAFEYMLMCSSPKTVILLLTAPAE